MHVGEVVWKWIVKLWSTVMQRHYTAHATTPHTLLLHHTRYYTARAATTHATTPHTLLHTAHTTTDLMRV
jgi:hypothetical protein